jgi:hypothetical protein
MSKWLLTIIILSSFSLFLFLQLEKPYEIILICIGFILEIIFLPYLLKDLIILSITIKNNINILFAFCTNILIMLNSFLFIITKKYHNNILFQIASIIVLVIVIIIICRKININKNENYNFSFLKSINLYFIASITTILFILKLFNVSNIFQFENWITFYYLLPFLFSQGMYEYLEGKSK